MVVLFAMWWVFWLDLKPAHFDEGINGWFVSRIWADGFYRYDPEHFHGPLYFYLLQLNELIMGRGVGQMRMLNVLFGWGSLTLLCAHHRWFGRAAFWAAAIAIVSPAFSFYSRYAIHESVFIFFQILFSYSFWRFLEAKTRVNFSLVASSLVGLVSVKETWFVFAVIWAMSYILAKWSNKWRPLLGTHQGLKDQLSSLSQLTGGGMAPLQTKSSVDSGGELTSGDVGLITACTVLALFFLYTGWGLDLWGAERAVQSILRWTQTGIGLTGHEKPWEYWIGLLWRDELWYFLAIAGGVFTLGRVSLSWRAMAIFCLGAWLAYSLIPYKTPWLILNFLWPATLMFGIAVEEILSVVRQRGESRTLVLSYFTFLFLIGFHAYQSLMLNFVHPTDRHEPYVYVQTTSEWGELWRALEDLIQQQPILANEPIALTVKQSWPLPYLLSQFPKGELRVDVKSLGRPDKPVSSYSMIFIDLEDEPQIRGHLQNRGFLRKQIQFRDGMEPIVAYLSSKKFAPLVSKIRGLEPY